MRTNKDPQRLPGPSTSLLRLMQLASPALPVGSYAYSQGLESAIEAGWISDRQTLQEWLLAVLRSTLRNVDMPLFQRLYQTWQREDVEQLVYWNNYLLASRETMEVRNEEKVRGMALWNLLHGLGLTPSVAMARFGHNNISYCCAYALASSHWCIQLEEAALAYVWGWAENQVLAAIKLMPVGQLAGQTLLGDLLSTITEVTIQGLQIEDDDIGALLPAVSLTSVLHETQYSRLFRS
jgi:urease accessory protein